MIHIGSSSKKKFSQLPVLVVLGHSGQLAQHVLQTIRLTNVVTKLVRIIKTMLAKQPLLCRPVLKTNDFVVDYEANAISVNISDRF